MAATETTRKSRQETDAYEQGAGQKPWLRRLVVTLGPLEEWRGLERGEVVSFASDGAPKGLRVTCSIRKSLMGSPQPSQISIHNLAHDTRDAIRGGLTKITVEAGWENTELHKVFQGSVLAARHERSGPDIVTRIAAMPGYGALVRGVTARTFGPGTPVRDVVKALAADMPGLVIDESGIEGINGRIGSRGWSFAGSTREGMTQLAVEHGFSWHIGDGAFKALGDTSAYAGLIDCTAREAG